MAQDPGKVTDQQKADAVKTPVQGPTDSSGALRVDVKRDNIKPEGTQDINDVGAGGVFSFTSAMQAHPVLGRFVVYMGVAIFLLLAMIVYKVIDLATASPGPAHSVSDLSPAGLGAAGGAAGAIGVGPDGTPAGGDAMGLATGQAAMGQAAMLAPLMLETVSEAVLAEVRPVGATLMSSTVSGHMLTLHFRGPKGEDFVALVDLIRGKHVLLPLP